MKILKIIFSVLAVFFGAVLFLYSFSQLFKSFDGLTEAQNAYNVGYHLGYLIVTVFAGWLGAWMFSKGFAYLTRKKADNENDREHLNEN
jgi:hypothetical protein